MEKFKNIIKKGIQRVGFGAVAVGAFTPGNLHAANEGGNKGTANTVNAETGVVDRKVTVKETNAHNIAPDIALHNKKLAEKKEIFEQHQVMDFSNDFIVDDASMDTEHLVKMKTEMHRFLASIKPENVNQYLASHLEIDGSSDERLTSRAGGNLQLTKDRLATIIQSFKDETAHFDWKSSGLSEAQIKEVTQHLTTTLTQRVSNEDGTEFPGADKGTRPLIADYTQEEINAMTPEQKEHAYKQDREVKLRMIVDNEKQFEEEKQEELKFRIQSIGQYQGRHDTLDVHNKSGLDKSGYHSTITEGPREEIIIIEKGVQKTLWMSMAEFKKFKETPEYKDFMDREEAAHQAKKQKQQVKQMVVSGMNKNAQNAFKDKYSKDTKTTGKDKQVKKIGDYKETAKL